MIIRFRLIMVMYLVACVLSPFTSSGSDPKPEGSSSSESRQLALRQVPLHLLNESAKHKLLPVLEDPSIFRRMPSQTIECDPELFAFLVRHPEVIVNIWDIMGVTNVSVDRTSQFTFKGQDGAGTACQAELIYGSDDVHIYFGNGSYDGTMVGRELKGRCVCILHGRPVRQPTGQLVMIGQMDIFLKLDNIGVDLIARTLSPFVGKTADYNFIESAKFVSQISRVAERNPQAIVQLASKMNKLQPAIRDEFIQVTSRVAQRNMKSVEVGSSESLTDLFPEASKPGARNQAEVTPTKSQLMLRR